MVGSRSERSVWYGTLSTKGSVEWVELLQFEIDRGSSRCESSRRFARGDPRVEMVVEDISEQNATR
eukprot:scaffold113_cov339-Pavlova_lutheri.AAC.49